MRKSVLLLASMALSVLLASGVALAAAGDLDTTFGGDGRAFDAVLPHANDIAVQPDGKVVAVSRTVQDDDFAVARFDPDGTPDESFGGDGRVITDMGDVLSARAYAVAIQRNGKLVAAGFTERPDFSNDMALVRYNPGGSLDKTFGGGDGKVTTSLSTGSERLNGDTIHDLIVQPDGRLVALGRTEDDYFLARYEPGGSLDESFGTGGAVIDNFGPLGSLFSQANDVIRQRDGKLVVGGKVRDSSGGGDKFALARYNANGTPDPTFGGDGKVALDTRPDRTEGINALALQDDGRVVAAGWVRRPRTSALVVARFNRDGSWNRSFGTGGFRISETAGEMAMGVAVQDDGKLVVADQRVALARYNPDGSLDETFGGDGMVDIDFGLESHYVGSLALDPDGKVVAGGSAYANHKGRLALARYLP